MSVERKTGEDVQVVEPERGFAANPALVSPNGWHRSIDLGRKGSSLLKLAAVLGVLAAGAWAYYANASVRGHGTGMSVRATPATAAFPVTLAAVERTPIAGTVTYPGTVAPYNEEDVYPRVTGRIVEMRVYPGDFVRPGQVIARLDSVELTSRVQEAEAMLASAEANRAQMEADLLGAHHNIVQMEKELAMVEAELTYARSVAARSERLFASGAVSRQEYENDRSMAASLEARRDAAQARLEQARAMEAAARKKAEAGRAMVAQARAAVSTANIVRDYVNITASSPGYVVKRLVAPGVLVQPGMPILKIAQVDRVRLQANVGEKDVASIRVGAPVVVNLVGNGHPPLRARVTTVFPFVDQGARTAVVEAVVENNGRRLLPGQYVTMQLVTGERASAPTVPASAVIRTGGKARVWVVQDGRAEPRDVATGLENPERVEITRGLAGGERVVARGHEVLFAGARVTEYPVDAPARPDGRAPAAAKVPVTVDAPAPSTEGSHAGH